MLLAVIGGIVVGTLTLGLLWRPIFGDLETFNQCVAYAFKPDLFSWLDGNLLEDYAATWRFQIWLLPGLAAGFGTYWLLS